MPYCRLFYHLVWTTKDRLPLITESNRREIYAAIAAKVSEMGGMVHVVGGTADHVHLLATMPPKVALAEFVRQIKGSSSHLAARLATDGSGASFAWQAEYGALTISEAHLPAVKRYVQQQQRHHAENSLKPALEACV